MPQAAIKTRTKPTVVKSFEELSKTPPGKAALRAAESVEMQLLRNNIEELGKIALVLAPVREKIQREQQLYNQILDTFNTMKLTTCVGDKFAVDAKYTNQRRLDQTKAMLFLRSMGKIEQYMKTITTCSLFLRRKDA